jgi:hypothetical protein
MKTSGALNASSQVGKQNQGMKKIAAEADPFIIMLIILNSAARPGGIFS